MDKVLRSVILAFSFGILSLAPTTPSQAEKNALQWDFKSDTPYVVHFAFFSRTFNRQWGPGGGKVWSLPDYKFHRVRLECTTGEVICYGAWKKGNPNISWGVGQKGKGGCPSCCYTCGQTTQNVLLSP